MLCQNFVNISSFDKTGKYLVQSIIFLIGKKIRLQIRLPLTGLLEIKIVERHMISPILQTTFPRLHLCILYYYKYSVINYHLLSSSFLKTCVYSNNNCCLRIVKFLIFLPKRLRMKNYFIKYVNYIYTSKKVYSIKL